MCKFWLPFVLAMTAFPVFADTVTLKTGEKLVGTVSGQTATDVTISVKISQGVTDDRTIQKTDIASMETEAPDDVAFAPLVALRPPDNAFAPNALDGEIGALQNFLDTYPQSKHVADVTAILQGFKTERTQLEAGYYKVSGKWMTKDDAMKQRYQIAAQEIYTSMQAQVTARDLIGAMNTFTQLEKAYPGARVFPDAVDLARQCVASLHPDVDRRLDVWQHNEDERVAGLALTSEPEKSTLIAAAAAEKKRFDLICDNAKKSGLKWIPLLPRSQKSLATLQTTIGIEEGRLADLPVDAMHQSIQAMDKASEDIEQKDPASADLSLKEAATLWPANHELTNIGVELTKLKLELKATPTPAPSAAKPTPKPAAAAPAPASAPVAGGAKPAVAGAPAAPGAPVAIPRPPPPADNGILSFMLSPYGIIVVGGVVLACAGGAMLATKARKQKEAAAE